VDIKSWDVQKYFIVYQTFALSQIVRLSTIRFLNSRTVKVFASCRTVVLRLTIFTLTLAQKFEVKFNKFALFHSKYYLHEKAEQKEDMKRKRILLTVREKQAIVNYCLERKELTPLT
jgi:hypothetical protein